MGLCDALAQLIREPALRQRLADSGYQRVRHHFSMDGGIDIIAERLGQTLAQRRCA